MPKTLLALGRMDNAETAFQNLFSAVNIANNEDDIYAADPTDTVLLFRGGEDIHPSIYQTKRIPENGAGVMVSQRDAFEMRAFNIAKKSGIPMLGICRGSQFLCAMSGGKLVQHVNGHGRTHNILTSTGKQYDATSTHHQMMFPWGVKHKLLAWSSPKLSDIYIFDPEHQSTKIVAEPEVVYFPESKALGIQGHPEYLTQAHSYTIYCNNLVKENLL